MKKDKNQSVVYALRRMSKAVDRNIVAERPEDKAKAAQWANLWARKAKILAPPEP